MRILMVSTLILVALAGCVTPGEDGPEACPGHWHFTLMLMGDGEIPYFSQQDMDASGPVPGIHMHGDDGLLHVHPAQQTCFTWAQGLAAVGVAAGGDGLIVDEVVHDGAVEVDVRPWGGQWRTHDVGILSSNMANAAQLIILVDPSQETRAQAREMAPEIPENYQPA